MLREGKLHCSAVYDAGISLIPGKTGAHRARYSCSNRFFCSLLMKLRIEK